MDYDNKTGERRRSHEWSVAPQNHSTPHCWSVQGAETLPVPSAPVLQVSFLPTTHHCIGASISLAVSKLYQLKTAVNAQLEDHSSPVRHSPRALQLEATRVSFHLWNPSFLCWTASWAPRAARGEGQSSAYHVSVHQGQKGLSLQRA